MKPVVFARQLWSGHRVPLIFVGLLLLANLVLTPVLQYYLVPTVNRREQQLLQRQADLRAGGGNTPAQLFAQGEKDLAVFRKRIPPYREFTGLIVELQSLADDAGLELSQIGYQQRKAEGDVLQRYALSFTLVGSYRDIKQFIHSLEQSPRLMSIEQIGLQGVGEASETDVRLQLNLETYFRPGVP